MLVTSKARFLHGMASQMLHSVLLLMEPTVHYPLKYNFNIMYSTNRGNIVKKGKDLKL